MNSSGSIVPKLEAAMGPRMTAGASGPQHAFIQRKTALSRHVQGRFGDGPNDWGTPRGPGRYLASRWNDVGGNDDVSSDVESENEI